MELTTPASEELSDESGNYREIISGGYATYTSAVYFVFYVHILSSNVPSRLFTLIFLGSGISLAIMSVVFRHDGEPTGE